MVVVAATAVAAAATAVAAAGRRSRGGDPELVVEEERLRCRYVAVAGARYKPRRSLLLVLGLIIGPW